MKLRNVGLTIVLALLAFGAVGSALAGPLEAARAAYDKKDYAMAMLLWRPLAEEGNAEAQRSVGILYDNGMGVPRDGQQATDWFRKAAAQGDADAEYRLGMGLVMGFDGLPHDVSQGLALMVKAGEQGHAESLSDIGDFYRTGNFGVPQDYERSVFWHRKAANLGYVSSQVALGIAYEAGWGVPKDISQSLFWFRKAANQGDVVAQYLLGQKFESGGDGFSMDKKIALCWYRKAVQHEHFFQKADIEKAIARLQTQVASGEVSSECE